jgi:hypothetical protein
MVDRQVLFFALIAVALCAPGLVQFGVGGDR